MNLQFSPGDTRWLTFYKTYGPLASEFTSPNNTGWVNFPCCLPSHPKKDRDKHGSLNLRTGSYKCWNAECQSGYAREVGKPLKRGGDTSLTPREFLIIYKGFTEDTAKRIVDEHRTHGPVEEFSPNDEGQSKKFSPPLEDMTLLASEAQKALSADLDIVRDYCKARGLLFSTLKEAGVGYIPEREVEDEKGSKSIQEECLIFPYYLGNQVVAIRGRTLDGRKGGVKNSYTTLYNVDSVVESPSTCVIIVEGETDTLSTIQALRSRGVSIPVVGTPGVNFQREWKRHLQKFTRILIVPQADEAATKFTSNIQEAFPNKVEVVNLPWQPLQFGKDISDFINSIPEGLEQFLDVVGVDSLVSSQVPRIISRDMFIAESTREIPWLIPGLIERGTKVLLIGEPKTYKTWLALQLSKALTTATPFLNMWEPTEIGKVLIVEEEGALHRMSKRIMSLFKDTGVPDNLYMAHRQGVLLDNPESLSLLQEDILKLKPDLLILDPYANLHTQDENTVLGTMVVVQALNTLLRTNPELTILVVHHMPKGGKGGARGSGALFGSVDLQISVTRVEETDKIKMSLLGRDLEVDLIEKSEFRFDSSTGTHILVESVEKQAKTKPGSNLKAINKKGSEILEYLSRTPTAERSINHIREALNMSDYSVRAALTSLEVGGFILKEPGNSRRSPATYRLKSQTNIKKGGD